MGCTNSKLQGETFDGIEASTKTSLSPKEKPSYSSQAGRKRGAGAQTQGLPTDDDAGIISEVAAPVGAWTADRERIRLRSNVNLLFQKQPTMNHQNLSGRHAAHRRVTTREQLDPRSPFVVVP